MERTNFWNMHDLHRKKIIFLCLGMLFSIKTMAQDKNWIYWDTERKIHFGFLLGTNFANFKYANSTKWYNQDSVKKVDMVRNPGISLGAVMDIHLGKRGRFDLRFTPTLTIADRGIRYTFFNDSTGVVLQKVESALIEFPVLFSIHSDRPGNVRMYAAGGFKYSYDLASNAYNARNPAAPIVAIYPGNFSYELATGLDIFYPYFKFSPEIKISRGFNNILAPHDDVYNNIFSSFRSNIFYFTLYFEG